MFHMPLFIFFSGYFSRKKDIKYLLSSIWKLLEPLLLFHFIGMILTYFSKGSISISNILTPWYVLWYLLSLIYWRLLLQVIPDYILDQTKFIIISTLCISIIAGFLPLDKTMSLQRTLSLMPFFFGGYCMRNKNLFLPERYKLFCIIFLIIIFVIPIYYPFYWSVLRHDTPYNNYYDMLNRIFLFCISIPMSLAFINICPNRPWSAKQGRFTMQYYIYHALIQHPFLAIIKILSISTSLLVAAVYTVVVTLGIGIASYLPYFTKFTNPSSFLKK